MQNDFCWPEDLPKSHVEEITVGDSIVSIDALRGLVRGILGPCVILQTHYDGYSYEEAPLDWSCWTSCEITADGQVSIEECSHWELTEGIEDS